MTPRLRLLALVVLSLTLAGCKTTINQILAEPQRYHGREVALEGEVVRSFSVLGHGAYMLDDGTGTIWVVSKRGVPRQGAYVGVRGRIRDVVDAGDLLQLPPEVGSGLVLLEKEHRAR